MTREPEQRSQHGDSAVCRKT